MTKPGSPEGAGGPAGSGPPTPQADPEAVLAQALRAMAGGQKPSRAGQQTPAVLVPRTRLSVLQIVLIAMIMGLLVGITVGLITLLL